MTYYDSPEVLCFFYICCLRSNIFCLCFPAKILLSFKYFCFPSNIFDGLYIFLLSLNYLYFPANIFVYLQIILLSCILFFPLNICTFLRCFCFQKLPSRGVLKLGCRVKTNITWTTKNTVTSHYFNKKFITNIPQGH